MSIVEREFVSTWPLCVLAFALLAGLASPALGQSKMWVTADTVNRRTCPDARCGIVGRLFFREAAVVFEEQNGWARVSKFYDASCNGGKSEYVDSGNKECAPTNGITDGRFAEWVSMEFLSAKRPADPSEGATGTAKLIGQSDDFRKYADQFVQATDKLIASGECTAGDFAEMGGWVKSSNQRDKPVYFTYCNQGSDRIYLDVSSWQGFQITRYIAGLR